jgi:hypothetical protein
LFAILKEQGGEMKVVWEGEKGKTFGGAISEIKLIYKDNFFGLVYTYDPHPPSLISSTEMKIIRWNGRSFSTVWTYEVGRHYARTVSPYHMTIRPKLISSTARTPKLSGSMGRSPISGMLSHAHIFFEALAPNKFLAEFIVPPGNLFTPT